MIGWQPILFATDTIDHYSHQFRTKTVDRRFQPNIFGCHDCRTAGTLCARTSHCARAATFVVLPTLGGVAADLRCIFLNAEDDVSFVSVWRDCDEDAFTVLL